MVKSRCSLSLVMAVGLTLATSLVVGCSVAKVEQAPGMVELPRQERDVINKVPLGGPFQITSARKSPATISATLPFKLAEVPRPAKLEMLVTGIESACPLHGQPQGATALFVNDRAVSSFTLGPSGVGRTSRVMAELEPEMLRTGENTLVLKGAPCTLGNFEVVKISDIVVRSQR